MSSVPRKYTFTWDVVGGRDIAMPELGTKAATEAYRRLQFSLHDALGQRYGTEAADELFFEVGVFAGKSFFNRYCKKASDLHSLVKIVQEQLRELGIVRFGVTDAAMASQISQDEGLDCSGPADTADHICSFVQGILDICIYDEGFVKGILDSFMGRDFSVREVECWCSDARTCRYRASFYG